MSDQIPAATQTTVTTTPAVPASTPATPSTPTPVTSTPAETQESQRFSTRDLMRQRIDAALNPTSNAGNDGEVLSPNTPLNAGTQQTSTPTPANTPVESTIDFDNFQLDLDSDPTEQTQTDPTQPTQQAATITPIDPAPEPTTAAGTIAEDSIPDTFTDAEKAIIERYRNMPGSQKIRNEAKFARQLSKPPEKGGLGYIPDPQDVVLNTRLADNLRAMVSDYQSGEPQAVTQWAQNWMFQLGQRQDGSIAPQFDQQSGTPILREGAQNAVAALVHNAIQHPETANIVVNELDRAVKLATERKLPWATQLQETALKSSLSGLVSEFESNVNNIPADHTTQFQVGGQTISVPTTQVLGRVINVLKSAAGLDQPTQPSNPEVEQLRQEVERLKQQTTQRSKTNNTQSLQQAYNDTTQKVLQTIKADVIFALKPLADALSSTEEGKFEVNTHQEALYHRLVEHLKANPGFRQRYNQFRADVRSGIQVSQTQAGLLKAARQAYSDMLAQARSNLLRSRLGSVRQATTTQQATVAQPASQQTVPINPVGSIPVGGRPTTETVSPVLTNGVPSTQVAILPGETRRDAIKRLMDATLQNARTT